MPLDAELSRDMDRITQLQDGILELLTQTSTIITALTQSARRKQTNPELPVEPLGGGAVVNAGVSTSVDASGSGGGGMGKKLVEMPEEEFEAMKHELLAGFLANARRLSTLIDSFPSVEDDPDRERRMEVLEKEMKAANVEYQEAVQSADALLKELRTALDVVMADNLPGYRLDRYAVDGNMHGDGGNAVDPDGKEDVEMDEEL